ncbi:ERCC4 domain containing protein [Leishmania braziliensis]|nr:ERCC4 domain containing protein [Leishmania braziliensis]
MSVEKIVTPTLGGTFRTCSEFIGTVSAREMPDNPSVQLCILSIGFNLESVVAQLLHQRMALNRPHRRVYCVVLPERLLPGAMTRFANAIRRHLALREAGEMRSRHADASAAATASHHASPMPVVAIEEGTTTKERCAVFQRGAVVVLTSHFLCADLLHRRLAVELVGMTVLALPHSLLGRGQPQDALAPQAAFCSELLLRSGSTAAGGQRPPSIVLISDAPVLMQSLVQRHHMGEERFVLQMHVGDIQLFPRFRLDFVRHFEELSRASRRPITVDRIVAPVAASVQALDGLLAKIVLETLQELQRLEQQLHTRSSASGGDPTADSSAGLDSQANARPFASPCVDAAAEADEDTEVLRFLPRARLTTNAVKGRIDYSGHPRSGTGAASYIRRGWRARTEHDNKGILFGGISEAEALSVDFSDLDNDLRAVVRRHESHWPYRLLVESLIDVRRLRRATRGTAYTFLRELEAVLEPRLPRCSVFGTGATPPAALWTLSSHFHDVVTVATHRIGTVVYVPSTASAALTAPMEGAAMLPANSADDVVVVVSSSSDSEERGKALLDAAPTSATSAPRGQVPTSAGGTLVPRLIPNVEEKDTDVEVVVRLVMSWCRTMLRRAERKSDATTDAPAFHPTLLILVFGTKDVVRYTERLTHSLEAYQQLQLRHFMRVYQAKYDVELTELVEAQPADAAAPQLPIALLTSVDDASSDGEEDLTTDEDSSADGRRGRRAAADSAASLRHRLSSQGGHATAATPRDTTPLYADEGNSSQSVMVDIGVGAFHQALLSQLPPLLASSGERADIKYDSGPQSAARASLAAPLLVLERVREGVVTLCPDHRGATRDCGVTTSATLERMPRVLVLDASSLSATELTMLLDGSHAALQLAVPSTAAPRMSTADTNGVKGTDSVSTYLRVDRVILARQELMLLRQLEMAQDELPAERLATIKVQLVTTSLAELDFKKAVQAERQAFESLAHAKATLTGSLLVDQTSLRQAEEALETGMRPVRRRRVRKDTAVGRLAGDLLHRPDFPPSAVPCIVFDERELRSSLPYHLYRRGMQLIPLTLVTADYVLSPEYAVERKSVQDYAQSVMSGRIQRQLAALSRRYAHPLCLIEFHRGVPFRLMQNGIYAKTAELMAAYPRVCFVWARSPAHAAGMLVFLKKSVAASNADPADPSLTGISIGLGSAADVGEVTATAAERETAHYAARVLSKLPGITHQNAPSVMRLCGSLIGLATISQASLVSVMGDRDAARLYNFLHSPFHERVG